MLFLQENFDMKRLLILFLSLVCFANVYSQHLYFLGIQLGQLETKIDELIIRRGFIYIGRAYEPANMYSGQFWIYKDVNLLARTYQGKVTEIIVTPNSSMYNQMADFNKLTSNLTKKYGKYYTTRKNGWELSRVWVAKGGCVEANFMGISSKSISIRYIDKSSINYVDPRNTYKRNRNNDL